MRVIYNQGDQRISVVPIHPVTGSPVVVDSGTDVTVSIVDLREHDQATDHTVMATTTVAQDTFYAVLTAAAGYSQADPRALSVVASGAAVGRTYLLQDTSGNSEAVKLSSVGTTSACAVTPLRGNYASGSTLIGVELVATFPSAEANDEDSVEDKGGPYLVTWTYVVDGQTVVLPTELWVDRYSIAPPIDEAYVLMAQPDMASRGRSQIASAIAVAWDEWLAALQSHGRDPSTFPPSHTVKVAVRKLALSYLNRWASGGEADNAYADALEEKAREMFANLLVGQAPQGQVELTRDEVSHVSQPKSHIFKLS